MAHYDPNDPRYNQAEPMARTSTDPHRPPTDPTADPSGYDQNTYVEPVATRASPIPLIIGIVLALALAYFVLERLMTREAEQATPAPAVESSEPAPETTPGETVEGAMQEAGQALEQGAAEAGAAVDSTVEQAGQALNEAAHSLGEAAQGAADAVGEAAQNAAEAVNKAVDNATQPAPAPKTAPAASN